MNYIFLVLEFIVLVTAIGLFIDKSKDTDKDWNINWGIALLIATLLMIIINFRFVCYGAWCFFSCGQDNNPASEAAKKAVAAYRRVKEGKTAKGGFFEGGSVDLNKLDKDLEEQNLFLGVEDPEQVKAVAERATKDLLAQNLRDKQAFAKRTIDERTNENRKNLADRPGLLATPTVAIPEPKPSGFGGLIRDVVKQTGKNPDPAFLARQKAARDAAAAARVLNAQRPVPAPAPKPSPAQPAAAQSMPKPDRRPDTDNDDGGI